MAELHVIIIKTCANYVVLSYHAGTVIMNNVVNSI